jgi:dTDP-4-dehydrorhamnose 3,5-epimerase
VVKAWHYHKKQTDNFTCVSGKIKLVLYDARKSSATFGEINEFILSLEDPKLVQIPENVYHGFKCIGEDEAVVINIPNKTYNKNSPDEYRIDAYDNDIKYDWKRG